MCEEVTDMCAEVTVSKIKVLIADDHPAFREGLAQLLNREEDIEVTAEASNGQQTVELAKNLQPDVALIDVAMPGINGIDAAKQIKSICPQTAIIMLTAYDYQSYILACLKIRAAGYLLKSSPVAEIVNTIRAVHSGRGVFDLKVLDAAMKRLTGKEEDERLALEGLHEREVQIVKLVAKGMSNREIARQLFISERTVQTHVHRIFEKLGVSSRTEAVLYCLREGWLTMEDLR
jgi:NarL family two-component system response regulator LiaR